MHWAVWVSGVTLIMVLGSLGVVGQVAGSTVPSLPTASAGQLALSEAQESLAAGGGPAAGHPLTCGSDGTLSLGCAPSSRETAAPSDNGGWGELCAFNSCPPPARGGAGLAYDAETGYVVLFGGIDNLTTAPNTTFGDTWTFAGGHWTQLQITGPGPRLGEYMAYDYRDHYIVMFGGGPYLTLNSSLYFQDTWTFQNDSWTELNLAVHPDARGLGGFTFDVADDYLVMYGGMSSETDIHSDTWTFWGGAWHNITTAVHPPALLSPALAYDPTGGYVLLFSGATPDPAYEFGDDLEQTWTFSAGVWTNLTGSVLGSPPDGRVLSSMAFDPASGEMILYGGWNITTGQLFGDTWVFIDNLWAQTFPSPSPAGAIIGANLIATSPQAGLILFGGIVGTYTSYAATNATWIYGPPPANTSAPVGGPGPSLYHVDAVSAPTSCQPPIFNQTTTAVGHPAIVVPGPYNASAGSCPGFSFQGWFVDGALTVAHSLDPTTTVDVVGNGTLTAYYEPTTAASRFQLDLVPLAGVVGGTVLLLAAALWVRQRRFRRLDRP